MSALRRKQTLLPQIGKDLVSLIAPVSLRIFPEFSSPHPIAIHANKRGCKSYFSDGI